MEKNIIFILRNKEKKEKQRQAIEAVLYFVLIIVTLALVILWGGLMVY